ncbi:MAG: hypothetical protein LKI21_00985 [Bifidobacterium crudilactis]|nr:hypothetical protein [Bifidobacterium crudilactis]
MASITVTTEPDSQPPVNRLTLHASDGCIFTSLTVTRIQDGSQTLIRRQPTLGTSDALSYDYEPRYGVAASYHISGSEKQADTGASTDVNMSSELVTLTPDSGWLIHPGNPAKSMPLPLGRLTGLTGMGRGMNATRHDVLGATLPVYTITGPRFGLQFTLELRTRTLDEESMLWALLDDQIPVLINWLDTDAQRLNMKPMYLQIGDAQADRFAQMLYPTQSTNTPGERREWKLPCVQVQSPAISQQAVGWTYADLFAEQPTYLAVQATYATYADLQAHNKKDGS